MKIIKYEKLLPDQVREAYREFMGFDAREAQIARLYEPRTVYLFMMNDQSIIGTISMIIKQFSFDRLPCEFSYLEQSEFNFNLPKEDLPAIEVGYLKVADTLRLRLRTYVLKTLCDAIFCQWYQCNAKILLLSCSLDKNLERLYNRFYGVEKIATIRYGSEHYSLMAKHKPITSAQPSYEGEYNAEKQTTFA